MITKFSFRACVLLVCLSVVFLHPLRSRAESLPRDCGLRGFITVHCDSRFLPKRERLATGVETLRFEYDGNWVLSQGYPEASLQQHANPLQVLVDEMRSRFSTFWKAKPTEEWGKAHGVTNIIMRFGGGRFAAFAKTEAGYVVEVMYWKDFQNPMYQYLVQAKLVPPLTALEPSTIRLQNVVGAGGASSGAGVPQGEHWSCRATGRFKICERRRPGQTSFYRACTFHTSGGVGLHQMKIFAQTSALHMCRQHILNMSITAMSRETMTTDACAVVSCNHVQP